MECSVEGCGGESNGSPEGSDTVNLCEYHWKAWGFYLSGYRTALGKDDGRLRRKLWNEAMGHFLEKANVEIVGLRALAEALG